MFRCPILPVRAVVAAGLALIASLAPSAARADLIVTVQSVVVTAGPGTKALDVVLTNTGPTAVTIGSFSVGLSTASAVTFTEANISTVTPYIFGANSAFGPIISTTPPPNGPSLLASDQFLTAGSGVSVASGSTVGLAHVLFLAPTPGVYTVSLLAFPTTTLSGPTGGNVTITTLANGTISVVPEPPTAILLALALPAILPAAARIRAIRRAR
ncbi:MAG: hypothetical protein U0800_27505 [Isosphaeraceae bacterium]